MSSKGAVICWFRRDLRLRDNPALTRACALASVENLRIIPLFILDDGDAGDFATGGASRWWLHHSLVSLRDNLNGQLLLRSGAAKQALSALTEELDVRAIFWNRCYEPWQIARDTELKTHFKSSGIDVQSFQASLLWEPWDIKNKQGSAYKVFTPYYRKGCLLSKQPRLPKAAPDLSDCALPEGLKQNTIDELGLLPSIPWYEQMQNEWQPGEQGASDRLTQYIESAAFAYRDQRNIPSVVGTSRLSPSLHYGELSPNQVWYAVKHAFEGREDDKHLDTYLSELGWREFSYYLLYHFPHIPSDSFNAKFDVFKWENAPEKLRAWQTGNTGIPIIDAGMRELWQTGYMHNRVRMVVGSFLVKNLRCDWRLGEAWFRDCLLDADLAANVASWQWVAGSGADAAPYFRIFNPVLQGEKFDSDGEYVKKYCPELAEVPKKFIHKPWEAPSDILKDAGVWLGTDYPHPIVDLKESREAALDAYEVVKAASNA
ncbi:MAG: DNA photolyase family protein [Oleiphilaceae bacterium]|nr:DNA photolyase family protein [Oleiphilaceae bacterium]